MKLSDTMYMYSRRCTTVLFSEKLVDWAIEMPEAVCLEPQLLNTCSFGTINDFNVFKKLITLMLNLWSSLFMRLLIIGAEIHVLSLNMRNNSCYWMCTNMSIIQYPYKCPTGRRMKVKSLGWIPVNVGQCSWYSVSVVQQ